MQIQEFKTWVEFRNRLDRYLGYDLDVRRHFIFRGQASRDWLLQPTLLRVLNDGYTEWPMIEAELDRIIEEFKQACLGLRAPIELPEKPIEWELLGRHHGLPTTILDWTESPYVAAYFAMQGHPDSKTEHSSVWVLDTSIVNWDAIDGVTIDKSIGDSARFNIRLAEQRGRMMRFIRTDRTLEDILGDALIRLDIHRGCRLDALADLDEMLINHRTLFRDLDGAVRSVTIRMGLD